MGATHQKPRNGEKVRVDEGGSLRDMLTRLAMSLSALRLQLWLKYRAVKVPTDECIEWVRVNGYKNPGLVGVQQQLSDVALAYNLRNVVSEIDAISRKLTVNHQRSRHPLGPSTPP